MSIYARMPGSVRHQPDGVTVHLVITGTARSIPVACKAALRDPFREGKGTVVQGALTAGGVFEAREVLGKHDENYMPPEAAQALEKAHQAERKD